MDPIDQKTIDEISDALRRVLVREIDKTQEENDDEIIGMLRAYRNWRKAFTNKVPCPELVEETPPQVNPKDRKVHFYEIRFGKKDDFGGAENQPHACIRGIRKPTLDEVNDWAAIDCAFFGAPVTEIDEIDVATARAFYDVDNHPVPVFGMDRPRPIGLHRGRYGFWAMGIGVFYVWARNPEEAKSAAKETWEANRDLLRKHSTFIAAVHGGLEPFPLPR